MKVPAYEVIAQLLKTMKDRWGSTWISKITWVFRRILFFLRSWFFDLYYEAISLDELYEALNEWKNNVLSGIEYVSEVFDCDDFAMYFKVWLQKWMKEKKNKLFNGVGIALGKIKQNGETLGGHAWNFVVVHSGTVAYILFVEPQLGELLSCTLLSSDGYEYELQAVII